MSLALLVAALESVPGHFTSVARSEQAAQQAWAAAHLLHEAVRASSNTNIANAWGTLLERCVQLLLFDLLLSGQCAAA